MSTIKINSKAKDFNLNDQNGKEIGLSSFKGKKVLLSFHPLAWTKVCGEQMKALEKNMARFEELNTVELGMSVDTVPSKKAWAKELGIKKNKSFSRFLAARLKLRNFMGYSGKKMDFPKGEYYY